MTIELLGNKNKLWTGFPLFPSDLSNIQIEVP
ncbi:hypothetical protein TUMEXPCC7403_24875 [Tumidithrix helvetica PCC 7403]